MKANGESDDDSMMEDCEIDEGGNMRCEKAPVPPVPPMAVPEMVKLYTYLILKLINTSCFRNKSSIIRVSAGLRLIKIQRPKIFPNAEKGLKGIFTD